MGSSIKYIPVKSDGCTNCVFGAVGKDSKFTCYVPQQPNRVIDLPDDNLHGWSPDWCPLVEFGHNQELTEETPKIPSRGTFCYCSWGKLVTWHKCLIGFNDHAMIQEKDGNWVYVKILSDFRFKPVDLVFEKAYEDFLDDLNKTDTQKDREFFIQLYEKGWKKDASDNSSRNSSVSKK